MSLNLCHPKFPLRKECLQMECKQNYLLFCAIKWAESTGMNLRTEPYTPALADVCSYISDLRRQLAVHLEAIFSFQWRRTTVSSHGLQEIANPM